MGERLMDHFGLRIEEGHRKKSEYDTTCSPNIFNEFATAAFRFGHSMVPENIYLQKDRFPNSNKFDAPLRIVENMQTPERALKE